MEFDYTENTEVIIGGVNHILRFENGMTGIGSRRYWIDDKKQARNAVRQTADITNGNHYIFSIKWRDNPWDRVDVIVSEDELPTILDENNKWMEPVKRNFGE